MKSFPRFRQTIIHQNIDDVFWSKHYENEGSIEQIIKFNEDEFSLQTSPPWIKYESMIHWYESVYDDPEFFIHDYVIDQSFFNHHDGNESFVLVCQKIAQILALNISKARIENFCLYSNQNLQSVQRDVKSLKSPSLNKFFSLLITKGYIFKIPHNQHYYYSSYSINRMAFIAGMHIHALALKKNDPQIEDIFLKRNNKKKFLFFIYQIMFSYFCSKIINPFKKCDQYKDFENILNRSRKGAHSSLYAFVIDIINHPHKLPLENRNLFFLYKAAHKIGTYLGEILFDNIFGQKDPQSSQILALLTHPQLSEEEFYHIVTTTLPNNYKSHKKRFF